MLCSFMLNAKFMSKVKTFFSETPADAFKIQKQMIFVLSKYKML